MSGVEVVPVTSGRLRKQFFHLPWQIYRDDPNWVPPLRGNLKHLLNFKPHPFYQHNRIHHLLAFRDGQPVGRIAAIVNQGHLDRYQDRRGFFGFYEAVDDQDVASALLEGAHQWLRQQGLEHMRGPTNPSLNYECGMLIDGFDSPPTFMITYNPPYYPEQMDRYGLHKTQDLYSFYAGIEMRETMDDKLRFLYREALRRFELRLRTVDTSRFQQDVAMFLDIYNKSLPGTWGFVPMSDQEVDYLSRDLKQLIIPELTTVAEVNGKPVGVVFGLLDYNPRIKRIDGRLFPFGFIHLLRNRRLIKRLRVISTNVLPEYQKWGLGLVLTGRILPVALEMGITEGEFSWVLESNHLSRKTLERGGAKLEKSFRIYDTESPSE